MKTKEYLIKNFIPIAKEEAKGFTDVIECLESIEHYLSIPMQLPVSGDFCGDCKRVIYEDESKFTGGTSSTYGVYYKANSKPICGHCINVRYENKVREFESKNSR